MADATSVNWTFLTNHAQVLRCIADDPGIRLREIGERVGITERAAHRIVVELETSGYVRRRREGRRNRYTRSSRSADFRIRSSAGNASATYSQSSRKPDSAAEATERGAVSLPGTQRPPLRPF